MIEAERYFTVGELAEALGVTQGRVRQMICFGQIKTKKFGHVNAIPESEFKRVVSQHRSERKTQIPMKQ